MITPRGFLLMLIVLPFLVLAGGCADDTTDLKQKLAELEKRVAKQEKGLAEFMQKFSAPKDFSADIQRLEDQQDRISQIIKSKVDPINMKLEEFRDWAQEAQGERSKVAEKLAGIEKLASDLQKRVDIESRTSARLAKRLSANAKRIRSNAKVVDELSSSLGQLKKEILDNNTRVVNALKKTLPKVKKAAVAEIKQQLIPLERSLVTLKTGIESQRKTLAAIKREARSDKGKDVQLLRKKIDELEEIIAAQKSSLLEIGSKMHELETSLRGGNASIRLSPATLSSR